eukprot:scaffold33128_cov41-Prasinocladus_malaysianus.AAC.1
MAKRRTVTARHRRSSESFGALKCTSKAVPKRILDLMNVEGLTRENVASHLQKYRLYLKRMANSQESPHSTIGMEGM